MDAEKAERAEWEKQSRLTVQETTKPCPKCKVPVEKAGECRRKYVKSRVMPGAGFTKPLRLTKARLSEFSWLVHTTNALVSQIVQL